MEFAGLGGYQGYKRLMFGAAPVLWAWPTLALDPVSALIVQWVGFTALWAADSKVTGLGWAPKWYSQYRFYLSILVGTCIIGSLAGTSYYGPVAGHGLLSHDLDMIRNERKRIMREKEGSVGGDVEAVGGGEDSDNYVIIKKKEVKQEKEGGDEGAGGAAKEGEGEGEGEAKEGDDQPEKSEKKEDGKEDGKEEAETAKTKEDPKSKDMSKPEAKEDAKAKKPTKLRG